MMMIFCVERRATGLIIAYIAADTAQEASAKLAAAGISEDVMIYEME
jgi:hypothetical protein